MVLQSVVQRMAKIVVTGGAGFIGSHIVRLALSKGYAVVVLDNLSTGKLDNLDGVLDHPQLSFHEKDICDGASYASLFESVDAVIHCAARISVAESVSHPDMYEATNVRGTKTLLDIAVDHGVQSFVLSSSAAVYGDDPALPKKETMAPATQSPYAETKLAGERLLQEAMEQSGIHTVSLRYFNVFGPKQDPHSPYAAAIPQFIDRALTNQPVTIYGDGTQTRDFIFVEAVAHANLLAAESGSGVVNIASGHATTIKALAESIRDALNSTSDIQFGAPRPGDIKHSLADSSKAEALWPTWKQGQFQEQLKQTIKYYVESVTT
jgi:UDP-glucose 4-epimerase